MTTALRGATTRTGTATATTVRVFGALAAVTGVEHGIGAVGQGSVAPPAMVVRSWPHVAAFDPLNGEPAMSLIPDLLVSGMLAVLTALALGAVALHRPDRQHSGQLLLGLSLLLLLVGGGFGPPLLGALAGLLATRIDAPGRPPGPATRLGARMWPWPLLVAAVSFLGLVPGTALLHAASGWDSSTLVTALVLAAFTGTGLAMWTARARDRVTAGGDPPPLDSGQSGALPEDSGSHRCDPAGSGSSLQAWSPSRSPGRPHPGRPSRTA